jgi:hypothetical protein
MRQNKLTGIIISIGFASLTAMAEDKWDISKVDTSKLPPASDKKDVSFAKDIRPMFEASCFRCHGEEKHKGGLRLDSLEAALKGGDDGKMIIAGDSKSSLLVASIAQIYPGISMPPKPKKGGPRNRPPGAPEGTNAAKAAHMENGGHEEEHGKEGHGPEGHGPDDHGPGGPGGGPGKFGPPAKPLTAEEVGIVRAWIDQGAK